jgi:hypothetical protein
MKRRTAMIGAAAAIASAALLTYPLVVYDHDDPRSRPNSYLIRVEETAAAPVSRVFGFIKEKKDDVYAQYNDMHSTFRIVNGDSLEEGAEIECVEGEEDGELTVHRYRVTRCVENTLIQYESPDTRIYDVRNGNRKEVGSCRVFVYLDFKENADGNAVVAQTIVIDMKNPVYKVIGDIIGSLSGSRAMWDGHAREELRGLLALAVSAPL